MFFKHFGVDVGHNPVAHTVFASQLTYVNMLTPIVTGETHRDGRTPDSVAMVREVDEFRSLLRAQTQFNFAEFCLICCRLHKCLFGQNRTKGEPEL